MTSPEETNTGPVIRDRRRIDPATGQVRDPGAAGQPDPGHRGAAKARPGRHAVSKPGGTPGNGGSRSGAGPAPETPPAATPGGEAGQAAAPGEPEVSVMLAERTADLQRVTAEYANYRKRVERDRIVVREQALANVLHTLLPVLDDIGRAREHGELVGGFKSVAESLIAGVTKLGLESFGEEGEPFDPTVHEALMHSFSADVTEPTCVAVLGPGYRVGERILRPARVAVAEPGPPEGEQEAEQEAEQEEAGEAPGEDVSEPGPAARTESRADRD